MESSICKICHKEIVEKLSHVVNVVPEGAFPADMPLVKGKLSCIICHYVHPFSIGYQQMGYALLRRPGKGPAFCSACHRIDVKDHIVFENVHWGTYQATDLNGSLDPYGLQCIVCHDKYLNDPGSSLGAGNW